MPDDNGKSNGKKKIVGIVVLVLVLGVVVSVVMYWKYQAVHIQTDDAFIDGNIYYVTPQIPGKVLDVLVGENEEVKKGQVLVQLETADLEANLHTAKQNLAVIKNQVAGQYASIKVVGAQMAQLQAQIDLAEKEKERLTTLLQKDAVAQDDLDKAATQLKALKAQLTATKKQKRQIKTAIGPKDTEGKEAAIKLAEAQIAQIELQIDHATIRAQTDGYITRKNVAVGQVVAAGQPLMSIVPLTDIFITANFKETQLTNIRPGQKVTFEVDTFPGQKFKGKVESIMAGTGAVFSLLPPQNATGNYIKVVQRIPVKIKIIDLDMKKYPLKVGMSVVPTILTDEPGL